ncbi:MAG: nicotinate-nucleotide adenylyltransferase [Acidimicrobiia bacterium]
MRTGILGGTFDPIHIAHLHAAQTALHQAGLDRVLIMPAGDPWQKTNRMVTPAHRRLEMARHAVAGVDGLEVDDRELGRDGPTYTVDTLATFPEEEQLHLIMGADAALGLPTWRDADRVRSMATILVLPRPGVDSTVVGQLIPEAVFLDMALLEISGTEIREMAMRGAPFRFLVTEPVHHYIVIHGLYAQNTSDDRVGASNDTEDSP